MNKRKLTVIFSVLLGIILIASAIFSASAYSDNDPLITLSYLEKIFAPALKEEIFTEVSTIIPSADEENFIPAINENETMPENIDGVVDSEQTETQGVPQGNSYTLLELTQGQTVLANSICEFIVRPGSRVTAVSPFPTQGIADITNGIEVLSGEMISINAYCLIPRGADGRGITVVGEKAYVMIRGDYTIG